MLKENICKASIWIRKKIHRNKTKFLNDPRTKTGTSKKKDTKIANRYMKNAHDHLSL
jgi:hypothetical protein